MIPVEGWAPLSMLKLRPAEELPGLKWGNPGPDGSLTS